jgi:hypothetical protein
VLLILTTIRRLALVFFIFLAWTPAAYAWSWPVQGPVLQPFTYDEAHPYAAGQHRGVDIGAESAGETVVAPAAGTVSFAGTVPTNGRSVTIETADGYSITLTHLGSIGVAKGATVAEEGAIGTVGPSGTPEFDEPYVHLGIRVTADPNGYVDPLGILPPVSGSGIEDGGSTASQPASGSASAAPPASKPASSAPRGPQAPAAGQSDVRAQRPAQDPPTEVPAARPRERPLRARDEEHPHRQQIRASGRASSSRRPVVEPPAHEPIGLDAGHTIPPTVPAEQGRSAPSSSVLGLVSNGVAALFAVGAALAADRRRRRLRTSPASSTEVLQLAQPAVEHRHFSRAA